MEEFNSDFILGEDEVASLFDEDFTGVKEDETPDNTQEQDTTEEVNLDELFEDAIPESVGSESNQEKEDTESKDNGTSPSNSIYSSIAKDLKEDGIFLDLDDETIASISDSESFYKALETQIQAKMDARSKRIDDALNYEIEVSEIKKFENAINYLDSITEEAITDEGENGEKLRQSLIYQDFLNRGFSKERAKREMEKSFSAGTDIEDAKEALSSNKSYITDEYDKLIAEAKASAEKDAKEQKKQSENLRKSIFEEAKLLGELELDKGTRQKIYDNIMKPVYKHPESGEMLTAIQKYESENRVDFLKNLGIIYTLTDGFKNLDKLVKDKVRKEVRKGQRELEHLINNTSRNTDGSLKFTSGVSDKDSRSSGFVDLAI
ncbi:MAG: hypothetical protein U0K68_01390 [Agathobacter sp.]|nr:hypothetical protein [Agathobacter sp.]